MPHIPRPAPPEAGARPPNGVSSGVASPLVTRAGARRIQIALQQDDGREPVDRRRALLDSDATRAQHPRSFHRRETLVLHLHWNASALFQVSGELLGTFR